MPRTPPNLVSHLRVIVAAWRNEPRDDTELMARYAASRNETAFTTLVGRHGALVWQTCRHVLGNTHDAEDAFQSTF